MTDYRHQTLPNGLQLLTVPMEGVESVTVLIGIGSGSRDESAEKAGLSHFLEHMALKGTKNRPTPFEVASVIDSVGGEQNAGTSKEFTEYWTKVASPHLETAFDFLADNLKNSIFSPQQIEKERKVIIEEINMYEDMPNRRVMDVFERVLYGNTPLGRDISGDKKTVSQIKRDDLVNYLNRFYRIGNLVLVVAGKFSTPKVEKLARKYFSDLAAGSLPKRKKLKFLQKNPRVRLAYKKTDQAHFCLGTYGVSYNHPDRFTVGVIASILGYSRTSRIYRRIREERGLAYYVYTIPEFYVDNGLLFTQAGVDLQKLSEAISLVKEEYFRLAKQKVSPRELKRAKDYLKGRFLLSLEDSYEIASRYALQVVVEKKIRTPDQTLKLIEEVSANDVLRVAQKIFLPQKLNLAVIGPYRDRKKFQNLL